MFSKANIVLPMDFSDFSQHAMRYAAAIARNYGGRVHVIHVIDPAPTFTGAGEFGSWLPGSAMEDMTAAMSEQAEQKLETCVENLRRAGVQADGQLVIGRPSVEILRYAEAQNAEMLVIATHGRSGFDHIVFGSVAERVVRDSPIPVLCVKAQEKDFVADGELTMRIHHVFFPTDFSEQADGVLPYAASLCRQFSARLTLFYACEMPIVLPDYLPDPVAPVGPDLTGFAEEALEKLRDSVPDVETQTLVTIGAAHREICRVAEEKEADLIVLPTHGRSGLSHVLFGSVAEKVVRLARCPVLTIRPAAKVKDES